MRNQDNCSRNARRLLYSIVLTLVFEGLLRKITPAAIGLGLFFLKDLLCLIGVILILRVRGKWIPTSLKHLYLIALVLLSPVVISTALRDPLLGLFGAKQYLLYAVVIGLVLQAFHFRDNRVHIFIALVATLLIPTALVSVGQDRLPDTHWLNSTPTGESLGAFSAAGKLRLSSTFSFTAQYSYFLNFVASLIIAHILYRSRSGLLGRLAYSPFLVGLQIVSIFITGGRLAVVGSGLILATSSLLMLVRHPVYYLPKIVYISVVGSLMYLIIRVAMPDYFIAYEARTSGESGISHYEELSTRILESLKVEGSSEFWGESTLTILFGRGIGVMSNGSEKLSSYAADIRTNQIWTETDLATTIWEGGLYLVMIWYTLRFVLILMCAREWLKVRQSKRALAVAPMVAFVAINGVTASLAIQPPIAIWWCVSIGLVLVLCREDSSTANLIYEHEF